MIVCGGTFVVVKLTKRGAEYVAKYGKGNPHIQHVRDAERLAKKEHELPHWKQ